MDSEMAQQVQEDLYTFQWHTPDDYLFYYVAIIVGLFIIFVSYFFGGARTQKFKVIFSVFMGVIVGYFTLPLLLKLGEDYIVGNPFLVTLIILVDFVFVAAVTCFLYELIVIRSGEAFPGPGTHAG